MKFFPLALIALFAFPAFALDLTEARTRGLVCEQGDGKLAGKGAGGDVSTLVEQVNAKRTAEYEKISKQNQQPIDVVGKLAAAQILKQPGVSACK